MSPLNDGMNSFSVVRAISLAPGRTHYDIYYCYLRVWDVVSHIFLALQMTYTLVIVQVVWQYWSGVYFNPPHFFLFINLPSQPTAITRLRLVAKVREAIASPRVPTPPAPPAQVHIGEMTPLHHTNLLTSAPWRPPPLHVPLHPPRGLVALGTLLAHPSLTLFQDVLYSHGQHATAQSPATLILSGECVCVSVRTNVVISNAQILQLALLSKRKAVCQEGKHTLHTNKWECIQQIHMRGSHGLNQSRFI